MWQIGVSHAGSMAAHLLRSEGADVRLIDSREATKLLADDISELDLPDVVITADFAGGSQSVVSALTTAVRDESGRRQRRCVICNFTASPPDLTDSPVPTSETLVNALVGLELLPDESSSAGELPVVSAYAAAIAAIEILVCLLSPSDVTTLEVPLASVVFTLLGRSLVRTADPGLRDEMSGPRFPLAEIYQCGDGRYIQCHGTTTRFSDALCFALDHPEWVDTSRRGMRSLANDAEVDEWRTRIASALSTFTAEDAQQIIVAHGGSATVCLTRDEWSTNDQALDAEIFLPSRGAHSSSSAPSLGAPVVVKSDASSRHARRSTPLKRQHLPLSGVRVLDLSIVLAGPTCGRVLAEWGADVIKVDSPTRPVSPYSWIDVNRSKRSLLVDLTTIGGKKILNKLIASADVIIENFRAGKLNALGFDYQTVSSIRPGIIYASMNAFDFSGPMEGHPGWEHNAEAASGMQTSRALNGKPQPVPYPVNDYMTGLLGSYGVLLALYQRERTALGALVQGSLSRSATFTQLARFSNLADPSSPPPPGRTCAIECLDGSIRVDVTAEGITEELQELRNRLGTSTTGEALDELTKRGYSAVRTSNMLELMTEGALSSFTSNWVHESAGPLRQAFTPYFGDHEGLGRPRHPAPDPGGDTMSILSSLGYDESQIRQLELEGAVRGRTPLFEGLDATPN